MSLPDFIVRTGREKNQKDLEICGLFRKTYVKLELRKTWYVRENTVKKKVKLLALY